MGVPRLPHLLGIEGLSPDTISGLLDLSESYIDQNRSLDKRRDILSGRTVINLFFENSTRTRTSFEVAANLFGRQGYPKPYTMNIDTEGLIGFQSVLVEGPIDQFRYPNVWDFDVRLAKNLSLGGHRRLTLAAEVFNALNANTELFRNTDASSSALNRLDEILAPRIARISARLSF